MPLWAGYSQVPANVSMLLPATGFSPMCSDLLRSAAPRATSAAPPPRGATTEWDTTDDGRCMIRDAARLGQPLVPQHVRQWQRGRRALSVDSLSPRFCCVRPCAPRRVVPVDRPLMRRAITLHLGGQAKPGAINRGGGVAAEAHESGPQPWATHVEGKPSSSDTESPEWPFPVVHVHLVCGGELASLLESARPEVGHSASAGLLVCDVRSFICYNRGHVRGAINLNLTSAMGRYIRLSLTSIERRLSKTHQQRFQNRRDAAVVLYDSDGCRRSSPEGPSSQGRLSAWSVMLRIADELQWERDVRGVYLLTDGYTAFASYFPQHIEGGPSIRRPAPQMTVATLVREMPASATVSVGGGPYRVESTPARLEDEDDIATILPGVYLCSERAASQAERLRRLGISRIINVASECDNNLEADGEFKYLRVELHDSPDEAIVRDAIERACSFIDAATRDRTGVVVHCKAGRSRSALVLLAFLLTRHRMPLDEAYAYLKSKRPTISPNLNYMGFLQQLAANQRRSPAPLLAGE